MIYRFLADITVAVHFAYVAVVVFAVPLIVIGGIRQWRWVRNRWFRGVHLAMILIVVAESWAGITCPLTTLENRLRRSAGDSGYQGDFIATWLHDLMFFDAEPWVFTLCYSLFGVVVITTIVLISPDWTNSKPNVKSIQG